jgi:subtilisin family serine protease
MNIGVAPWCRVADSEESTGTLRPAFDEADKEDQVRRKLLIVVAVLATAFAGALPASGTADDTPQLSADQRVVERGKYNSYIVVMKAQPLVVTEGRDNLDTSAARARGAALRRGHERALEETGLSSSEIINDYVNSLNGFSATLSYAEAVKMAGHPDVAIVVPDELLQKQTDSSGTFLGLDGKRGAWNIGYDGEGVVVGVIDTGIWPEHPSFADDGSYSDPGLSIPCEFGNTAHNPNDVAFTCNNKLIGARQMLDTYRALIGADPDEFDSARDDDGHGTHTASTAAGNAGVEAFVFGKSYGEISGIAPRAHVVAYKGLGNQGGFTSDLAAAIDQAVADGVDVINYSIGGGAAGPGADEIAFLFAADAGVYVATSAGNSGSAPATVGNPGTMPWLTTVGASTQPRFIQGTVRLGNGAAYKGASITPSLQGYHPLVDAEDAGGDLCVPGSLDPAKVTGAIVLCRRGAVDRTAKSLAVQQAGGVGVIHYENTDDNNLFTDSHWLPTVHVDNTPGLAIKSYIDSAGNNAKAKIVNTGKKTTWPSAPSMTIFSSRGPNPVSADIIKPDVTAPGMQILAGNSPFPDPGSTPPGELFQAIAGTSMSSPHVAGLFALLKQAHPDWSAAAARSALMTTAYQDVVDNDRISPADPFDFGAGHVDPSRAKAKGSAFQPGLVYEAGLFEYAAYTCGEGFGVFTEASCDFLDSIGVPSDPSNLNYPSIGVADVAGTFTVTRTVTSVAKEGRVRVYTADVDAPPGYDVTVSPDRIALRSGQSATFEVTIVNETGPIGEWRFGSLNWNERTGKYDVYSPIAVKGALFDAPTEVTATGTSGSTSFDVLFGYTGDYTAAPHGLAADTGESDSVSQDADQTFSPDDVNTGGAVAHEFTLDGSAHLRITMDEDDLVSSDPTNTDIDLYLYKDGVEVASSTAGGTGESIDIQLPDDGTYTLYVHGWQVVDVPSVDYTFHLWDVPLATGGSLSIDSAPTSAVLATSGTIEVSWDGLSSGMSYLGAVSHSDASGLLGLTLVSVDGG